MKRYALPSHEVCARLDIATEELNEALQAFANTANGCPTLLPSTGEHFAREKCVALHHDNDDATRVDSWNGAGFEQNLDALRALCAAADEYIESAAPIAGPQLDAARDSLRDAVREALRAIAEFEDDWNRRSALLRLAGTTSSSSK